MAQQFPCNSSEIPSVVVIGVANQPALRDVMERLVRYGIRFAAFYEPDFGMGLSAISTIPLNKKQRHVMSKYSLWQPREINGGGLELLVSGNPQGYLPHQSAVSSVGRAPGLERDLEAGGSNPSPRTKFAETPIFTEQ